MQIHTYALTAVLSVLALSATATAQTNTWDIMHYPFITSSSTRVLNLATGTNKAPDGKITSTGAGQTGTVAGKPSPGSANSAGFALAGSADGSSTKHNWMDTGWKGGITGSMTIAWDMKYNSLPVSAGAAFYIISGMGSFRIYHNGNAYLGLKIKAWGAGAPELRLGSGSAGTGAANAVDLHSMSKNNWIHIAIVIDHVAKTGTWYVNATPVRKYSNLAMGVSVPAQTTATMKVGMHTSLTRTSCFDIDNFRLVNKAATVAELKQWANQNVTADKFSISRATGGALTLNIDAGSANGNKSYVMAGSVTGAVPGISANGVHVPINFDPWTDITLARPTPVFVQFAGVLTAAGKGRAQFVVPANAPPSALGITFFHSGLIYDATTLQWLTGTNCNPLVIFP